MLRKITAAFALVALAAPALADAPAAPAPNPTQQALAQMVSEAQGREATALVQVYTLQGQIGDLKKQVETERKRAVDAELKLKQGGADPTATAPAEGEK